jgi:hypothetical protein
MKANSAFAGCAGIVLFAGLLSFPLSSAAQLLAQNGTSPAAPANNSMTQMDGRQVNQQIDEQYLREQLGDPKETAAYQAFHKASEDGDKKIHLGVAFLAKYPSDRYTEAVYDELSQTYYDHKDLPSFYLYSDKGIALFPDDVYLLALSGWAIPRAFDAKQADADKQLDKAEVYEKHAMELLDKMIKPSMFSDDQFAQYKTQELSVVHSGLGFVYFRREKYDDSEKELEIATKDKAQADPNDLFVLGADLHNLGRYKEAADAFNRCAKLSSPMQDNCKKYAADAEQRASSAN